jgi:hypothetical protein
MRANALRTLSMRRRPVLSPAAAAIEREASNMSIASSVQGWLC